MYEAVPEEAGEAGAEGATIGTTDAATAATAVLFPMPGMNSLSQLSLSTVGQAVEQAALRNATTQGIRLALNQQSKFSWSEVADSAVAAPLSAVAGAAVGQGLNSVLPSGTLTQALTQTVQGYTSDAVTQVVTNGKVSLAQIATDEFGNELGNAIVGQVQAAGQQQAVLQQTTASAESALNVGEPGDAVLYGPEGDSDGPPQFVPSQPLSAYPQSGNSYAFSLPSTSQSATEDATDSVDNGQSDSSGTQSNDMPYGSSNSPDGPSLPTITLATIHVSANGPSAFDQFLAPYEQAWSQISQLAESEWQSLENTVSQAPSELWNAAKQLPHKVLNTIETAIAEPKQALVGAGTAVYNMYAGAATVLAQGAAYETASTLMQANTMGAEVGDAPQQMMQLAQQINFSVPYANAAQQAGGDILTTAVAVAGVTGAAVGLAPLAGDGLRALGETFAPALANATESFMMRTGGLLPVAPMQTALGEETVAETTATESVAPILRDEALLTEADPARALLGPATVSNPTEVAQMRQSLNDMGVEVIDRPGSMAYAPGLSSGQPGQMFIDPDASYSAWLHEYQHALDDQAIGWGGMQTLFDNDLRWQWEQNAYGQEINYAQSLGHDNVVQQLQQNMEQERQTIFGEAP